MRLALLKKLRKSIPGVGVVDHVVVVAAVVVVVGVVLGVVGLHLSLLQMMK